LLNELLSPTGEDALSNLNEKFRQLMVEADVEVKQLTMQRLQQIANTTLKVHGDTHKSREQGGIPRMYMQMRQLLDEVE